MWLINVDTRELECFNDERKLPPYAILSHTWTGSEVTMQQYREAIANREHQHSQFRTIEGKGYFKIQRTCAQAHVDGLAYVWIDTCCIDKTSSAELSEAINSMFRWYERSVICYVYLEDIKFQEGPICRRSLFRNLVWEESTGFGALTEDPDGHIEEEQLSKAKWFTRGWTLQELIAPFNMTFYDQDWLHCGRKSSLAPSVSKITGVDYDLLCRRRTLGLFSIAERMTWAAGRHTTKVEDIAYSLFGIFDVNLPSLWGRTESLCPFARRDPQATR
ncbi:hypothetical protein E8E11_005121 [Didymella keratinophila]|nr:hypothetical protein E8E11_005121 [Didymella keratinophila]